MQEIKHPHQYTSQKGTKDEDWNRQETNRLYFDLSGFEIHLVLK